MTADKQALPARATLRAPVGERGRDGSGRASGLPLVALDRVTVRLGERVIQHEMSFTLVPGELVAVLGPNGAGKSTLLKLLLGLIKPAGGSLSVFGAPPKRGNRLIGYAPQFGTIESDHAVRVRDVVGFGLDGHRWGPGWPSRAREAAIEKALDEVGALALADVPANELSGGEQQRLLIAQALLTDPKLLLLDEPLSNLDLTRAQEVIQLVDGIRRSRGVAVLFVTHDVNPLLPYLDRVLYMANAQSVIGLPDEVITRERLSAIYGSPVEVVEALGRLFVVGVET